MNNPRTFLYVANRGSREIMVLQLDSDNGDLKPIQQAPVNGAVMPMEIGRAHV